MTNQKLIDDLRNNGMTFVKQDRRLGQTLVKTRLFVFYISTDIFGKKQCIKKLSCFDFLQRNDGESDDAYIVRFKCNPTPPFIKFTDNDEFSAFMYKVENIEDCESLKKDILYYLGVPLKEANDFEASLL